MTIRRGWTEPEVVYPEQHFEAALQELVQVLLAERGRPFVLVPHFGLDIAAFVQANDGPRTLFLEAKAFNGQRPMGVGFGNSRGEGPQVEILLCDDRRLATFNQLVRWALVDATEPFGSRPYGLFTSEEMKASVMAGISRGKQNNFNVGKLRHGLSTWPLFCEKLAAWIASVE